MAMTPLPPLDPSSPTFRSDVDAFFRTRMPAFVSEANAMQANLNALAAGGALSYSLTGWGDPATVKDGVGRFNIPGPQASVGVLYFNSLDLAGNNILVVFSELFANTNANRGYVTFLSTRNFGKRLTYRVTGYAIDNANSRLVLYVAFVAQTGDPIYSDETVVMQLSRTGDTGPAGTTGMAKVQHREASGVPGGVATASTFAQVRGLNTTEFNAIGNSVTLSGNSIVMNPGTYFVSGRAPAYGVGVHKAMLYNETDAAFWLVAASAHSGTGGASSDSTFSGQFTIATPKSFTVRHFMASAAGGANNALGVPVSSGQVEIYTEVVITKIA